jgi:hypothetical protein
MRLERGWLDRQAKLAEERCKCLPYWLKEAVFGVKDDWKPVPRRIKKAADDDFQRSLTHNRPAPDTNPPTSRRKESSMGLEHGWLARECKQVEEDYRWMPSWIKKAAGEDDGFDAKTEFEQMRTERAALRETVGELLGIVKLLRSHATAHYHREWSSYVCSSCMAVADTIGEIRHSSHCVNPVVEAAVDRAVIAQGGRP